MKKYIVILFHFSLFIFHFSLSAQVNVGADGAIHPTGSYPVALTSEIKGAAKQVADISARNAIASNLRTEGMEVYVVSTASYYQLIGGIADGFWTIRPVGAVSSVNGSTGAVTVQPTLVSATNIKTINGSSVLGSGDLTVTGTPTASNGLTATVGDVAIGGTLTKPTTIATNTQSISITGTGSLNIGTSTDNSARVNITQTADSTIIDFKTGNNLLASPKPNFLLTDLSHNELWRMRSDNQNFWFGKYAGLANVYVSTTQGDQNFAIGDAALQSNVGGYAQTAVGRSALSSYIGGTGGGANSGNVAIGFQSLGLLTSGTGNTGLGTDAGLGVSTGSNNTFLGYHVGKLTTGVAVSGNTVVGSEAFTTFTTASVNNTIVGALSSANNKGANNTFVGYTSGLGSGTSTGGDNTAVGSRSLENVQTGFENTSVGRFSNYLLTTGYRNTAIGNEALFTNTIGIQNTAIGHSALNANTVDGNTAIGYFASKQNTNGYGNTSVGAFSGYSNIGGYKNLNVGTETGYTNTTGFNNVNIGYRSGFSNNGNYNIAIGTTTMSQKTSGNANTGIGDNALSNNLLGNNNTAIGSAAASGLVSGSGNIYIGFNAGSGAPIAENNQLYIGNGAISTNTWIKGDSLLNIGIGTITPQYKLDVASLSTGNPMRLQGLKNTTTADSVVVYRNANAGVLERMSIAQVVSTTSGTSATSTNPSTASTVAYTTGVNRLVVSTASLIAALTITLPSTPVDNQTYDIHFIGGTNGTAAVTAVSFTGGTINTSSTTVTTASYGDSYRYVYHASSSTWLRIIL